MLLDASPSYRLPKSYPVLAIYVHYASIEYSINDRTICLDTPFICFKLLFLSVFIRFSTLSNEKSKVVPLQHEVTLQPNMIKENVKIMNWRNGFLLSLVSYILYLIIWLILDDETANQLPGMATVDYVVDFLLCMLFTYISLGFSYLVFKILPFRTSYVWVIVYASCLLTLNNLVAFGMTSLFNLLWDETGNGLLDELINMKGAYTFA